MHKLLMLSSLLLLPGLAVAEEDDDWGASWDDDTATETVSPWQFNGFIELAYGSLLQQNPLFATSHHSLGELRSQIALDYTGGSFVINAKADLLYDEVLSKPQWQTRTLSLSASPSDTIDLKIGRQVLTWGTGDYVFLNDLFAKDWQSFFSGRDDQYLKAPSDSIKLSYYFDTLALDLVWTPDFTPDHYLSGERFSYYSPQLDSQIAPSPPWPVDQTKDSQLSARLSGSHGDIDYALYGYKGYWNTPQGQTAQGIAYFPRLYSWGISATGPLSQGLVNLEMASYNADNSDPLQANGQLRLLLGYQQELAKNLSAGVQFYVEKTKAYQHLRATAANPEKIVDKYRQLLTLRLGYLAMAQKLHLSLFAFYSPSDQDSYLRPSISYRRDDHWHFSVGANLFGGSHNYSFFGQHQDNSNGWFRIRYNF